MGVASVSLENRCFLGNIDFTLHKCEKRNGVDVAPLGNRAAITRCKWDENRNILKGGVVTIDHPFFHVLSFSLSAGNP